MLLEAVPAVDGFLSVRLEGYFAFFAALGAYRLVHLSRTAEAAPVTAESSTITESSAVTAVAATPAAIISISHTFSTPRLRAFLSRRA